MNIYKFHSEYISNDKVFAAEVFVPDDLPIHNVLKKRCLPNESITSAGVLCVRNNQWITKFKLHEESVAFYIYEKRYVDAIHRLMYLTLVMGEERTDFIKLLNDDGLMHQLVHLKSDYTDVDIEELTDQAQTFESNVPGTFLWAMSQVKT